MVALAYYKKLQKLKALTLVEVLISLAIVSLVFVFVVNATFDALRQTKKLELEDQMLNYASEGIEFVKQQQGLGWNEFTQTFQSGAGSAIGVAYIKYDDSRKGTLVALQPTSGPGVSANCTITTTGTGSSLEFPTFNECKAISVEPISKTAPFGRIIKKVSQTANYVELRITVACFSDQCQGSVYKPIELTTYVFRTSAQ